MVRDYSALYLSSRKAPARIAELLPDAKLVFMLRDPVARTYSHYWHDVRYGRVTHRFEQELLRSPGCVTKRSLYRLHVKRYLKLFPRENLTFLIFEDFLDNMQMRIDEVCAALGLSKSIDLATMDHTSSNPSRVPRWPRVLRWQNYLFSGFNDRRAQYHLPGMPQDDFGL